MKDQLFKIYTGRHSDFKTVKATYPNISVEGPLLVSPNDKYNKQQIPFLVVGQETHGWASNVDDINEQMVVYEKFNVATIYRSTFWNVIRKIESILRSEPYSCAWTNISKFDINGGRAFGMHAETISTLDNIILDEIRILNPKLCMFFTGPAFDQRILKLFPGLIMEPVEGFSLRQLCRLKHINLPHMTFRSYHPNYLRRKKLENGFLEFLKIETNSL